MINHEKRRDDTKRLLTNANEILQHVQFNKLLLHRLAKFEFLVRFTLYFFPLPLALLKQGEARQFDSHHYTVVDIQRTRFASGHFLSFFLFASIFSRSPLLLSLTNFFSLMLLFIATAFEAIFTSVSLPGLAILTPAFPLTCFVTHNYSLKLTPTSLLLGVY